MRERERERERELRTLITQGWRFWAIACSYNLSLLSYLDIHIKMIYVRGGGGVRDRQRQRERERGRENQQCFSPSRPLWQQ